MRHTTLPLHVASTTRLHTERSTQDARKDDAQWFVTAWPAGWASLPDPHGLLYERVGAKLRIMRYRMRHGEAPVAGRCYVPPATGRLSNSCLWVVLSRP